MAQRSLRITSFALLLAAALGGCDGPANLSECLERARTASAAEVGGGSGTLSTFESSTAFDGWVASLQKAQQTYDDAASKCHDNFDNSNGGYASADSGAALPNASPPSNNPDDQSITNNQEVGVDEGDIVKAYKDYLVILRRGRLFTVRLTQAGRPALAPVFQTNAYAPGSGQAWYDEMLIRGDRIIVVGYSYTESATELGLFRIDADGKIKHEATHFLSSNDYYSSRNYASRLIGDTLVFYMPFYMMSSYYDGYGAQTPELPSIKQYGSASWRSMLDKKRVVRPLQPTSSPTLHTVVRCDVSKTPLSCSATALVGPYARTFYVSRDAVYLWISGDFARGPARLRGATAMLYRMPLDGSDVKALAVQGAPVDQFSFKEAGGFLNVFVRDVGGGDAMWQPEYNSASSYSLLRVALSKLSATPSLAAQSAYRRLPTADGYEIHNRFVGDWLLYGEGGYYSNASSREVHAVRVSDAASKPTTIALGHAVERIEALGNNALVVGSGDAGLRFSALRLDDPQRAPYVQSTHDRPGATQGETRSHGFFFMPGQRGSGGTLALPVRFSGGSWSHLLYGSAQVVFLSVDETLKLSPIGELSALARSPLDDHCVASCTDWYGNARPIFYGGRVFALMGYELIEGQIGGGAIRELGRTTFLQ
ncbi:MAG: beta-propeller domain-containing protein [Myxococcales bacterium]|nr:beta-propeller domain-containing protein [Myxococcales bacterium]